MVPFAKNSLPNGLELLVDVETYDYAASSAESEGIFMSILYQLDMPIMKNTGISLEPGLHWNLLPIFCNFVLSLNPFWPG